MQPHLPKAVYQKEIETITRQLTLLFKKRSRLGWARLAAFVLTGVVSYNVFQTTGAYGLIPLFAGMGGLLYLVAADVKNKGHIRDAQTLLQLNNEELLALSHRFSQWPEGRELSPPTHGYAGDMDIFGGASIFQWLSRCYTEGGQRRLANGLLKPLPPDLVLRRQKAVKELQSHLQWRQRWQAIAMQTGLTDRTQQRISAWATETVESFSKPWWPAVVMVYSLLTAASLVATVLGFISATRFASLLSLYFFTSLLISRNAVKPYHRLSGAVKEVSALQALIAWVEKPVFTSPHLQNLQTGLRTGNVAASGQIASLQSILNRFDVRNNLLVFFIANSFLLWDVRQVLALNGWRKRYRQNIGGWFAAIAEMDVLHSLATLHFNEPSFCFPQFTDHYFTLSGEEIAHPLLPPAQRVANHFTLNGAPKVGLITGSNMAGKSTFLRSLGVNMVLAQMGAPVCATAFTLSPTGLLSSMRVADNLAENTSTFYAELKKLRTIIDEVKQHKQVFILLDEILRGTNSFDRHKGSSALVKQLVKEGAVALLATHDVELAALQSSYPSAIDNYHFDATVDGEELYFDYKLKPGVCQSINASLLMKKIGIDLG